MRFSHDLVRKHRERLRVESRHPTEEGFAHALLKLLALVVEGGDLSLRCLKLRHQLQQGDGPRACEHPFSRWGALFNTHCSLTQVVFLLQPSAHFLRAGLNGTTAVEVSYDSVGLHWETESPCTLVPSCSSTCSSPGHGTRGRLF